jgi:Flp pilus assembly protein TadD
MQLRDALAKSERELAAERRQLEDARRRGTLAADVDDAETVAVAERFTARHGERVTMLEQKLAAQQAELALTERDVNEVVERLRDLELRAGVPPEGSRVQPPPEVDDSELGAALDRAGREAEAEARLRELKNRMGR